MIAFTRQTLSKIIKIIHRDKTSLIILLIGVIILPAVISSYVHLEVGYINRSPHFQIRNVGTTVFNMFTPEFMVDVPDINVVLDENERTIQFHFLGDVTEETIHIYINNITYTIVGLINDFYGYRDISVADFLGAYAITAEEIFEQMFLETNEKYNLTYLGIIIRFLEINYGGVLHDHRLQHISLFEQLTQKRIVINYMIAGMIVVFSALIIRRRSRQSVILG